MKVSRAVFWLSVIAATHAWAGNVQAQAAVGQPPAAVASSVAPLPGKSAINKVSVAQNDKGEWIVTVDYFYTGDPEAVLLQFRAARESRSMPGEGPKVSAKKGAQTFTRALLDPTSGQGGDTRFVIAELMDQKQQVVASQHLAQTIRWPSFQSRQQAEDLKNTPAPQLLDRAIWTIDNGDRSDLMEAKKLLEHLLAQNPKLDQAYIELARVAMKTNWGPQGLHEAEALLASARSVRPDSVNAKILLGYVYAHQRRFKEAEALFVQAAATKPRNLWLWSNWGEVLVMQGKTKAGIEKYREGLSHPKTNDTYDRAREDAYRHLLALLRQNKDKDLGGMDALYLQRASEYGKADCYGAEYAQFLLMQRGKAGLAADWARQALNGECGQDSARRTLGASQYVAWANTQGPGAQEALNQARIYLPVGPQTLSWLASSEHTLGAVKKLLTSGESIERFDNQKMNALGHALQAQDGDATRRLLQLGAKSDTLVGGDRMPVAFLPVLMSDVEGVRIMQKAGVDYTKLRYQGMTALDHANMTKDRRMLEALGPRGQAL